MAFSYLYSTGPSSVDSDLLQYLKPEDIAWLKAHGADWLQEQRPVRALFGTVTDFDKSSIKIVDCEVYGPPVCDDNEHEWQRIDTFDSFKIREFCSRCGLDK